MLKVIQYYLKVMAGNYAELVLKSNRGCVYMLTTGDPQRCYI